MTDELYRDEANRASVAEVLEFCNKVREAGGANPLDALMPSVREEAGECLIARNLNFSCEVDWYHRDWLLNGDLPQEKATVIIDAFEGQGWAGDETWWYMKVDDLIRRHKIAKAMGLPMVSHPRDGEVIVLPARIGRNAQAFDRGLLDPALDEAYDVALDEELYSTHE